LHEETAPLDKDEGIALCDPILLSFLAYSSHQGAQEVWVSSLGNCNQAPLDSMSGGAVMVEGVGLEESFENADRFGTIESYARQGG